MFAISMPPCSLSMQIANPRDLAQQRLSITSHMNKSKILELAKGFRGRSKNCIRIATNRVERSLYRSYIGRRLRRRDFRSLWIERINAAARSYGVKYGLFMHGLFLESIQLNRKVLSELSILEPYTFKKLVDISTDSLLTKSSSSPHTP